MTLTRQGGKGLSAVPSAWDILPFMYTGQSPLIRQHPAVRVHSCSEQSWADRALVHTVPWEVTCWSLMCLSPLLGCEELSPGTGHGAAPGTQYVLSNCCMEAQGRGVRRIQQ